MITTIYYLIGVLFMIYEIYIIVNIDIAVDSFEVTRTENVSYVRIGFLNIINLFYTVWLLIGVLFSSQILLFASILIISLVGWALRKYRTRNQMMVLMIMESLGCMAVIGILISRHMACTL
jgi:hypothetical protein